MAARAELKVAPPQPTHPERRLSELLWKPLCKYFPETTEVVYVAPDAELTALPWPALPGRERDRLLLEEHAIAMVPHGLYLLEQLQIKARPLSDDDKLVVFGGVSYDQPPGVSGVTHRRVTSWRRDRQRAARARRYNGPFCPARNVRWLRSSRWQANAALWPKWSPGQRGSTVARSAPSPLGTPGHTRIL